MKWAAFSIVLTDDVWTVKPQRGMEQKEGCWGLLYDDDLEIRINAGMDPYTTFWTILHEIVHIPLAEHSDTPLSHRVQEQITRQTQALLQQAIPQILTKLKLEPEAVLCN